MSNAYISKIQLPNGGAPYLIKDAEARNAIDALSNIVSGSLVICGETTTDLVSSPTATPVVVKNTVTIRGQTYEAGSSYTPVPGDVFFYNSKEFVYDGTNWIEFGDITGLGTLAFADQASASYTPAGSVSASFSGTAFSSTGSYTPDAVLGAPDISLSAGTGGTTVISNPTARKVIAAATQGTLPDLSMVVTGTDGETLSISWGAGTLPTFTSADSITTTEVTAVSSVPAYTATAPSFTGTPATITVTGTPAGSITGASFTGTPATITAGPVPKP